MAAEDSLLNERNIELAEILRLVKRHTLTVVLVWIVVFTATFLILRHLPEKYKSTSTLNIPSSYFSNPLVRELVPEPSEPGELNAQRISLLQFAMSEEFLDTLGENYSIYEYPRGTSRRIEEREALRRGIEFFTLNPTTVQVSIVNSSGKVAFLMMEAVLKRMVAVLIDERYKNLEKARDAIEAQSTFLARALTRAKKVSSANNLEDELRKINTALSALRLKYTERHPEVAEMRNKADAMAAQLARENGKVKPLDSNQDTVSMAAALANNNSASGLETLYNDLLHKLSYLNIALNMERGAESMSFLSILQQPSMPTRPFFPNPKIAVVLGALLSTFISVCIVLISETRRRTMISPSLVALALDTHFLGELPRMPSQDTQQLLINYEERRALPPSPLDS